MKVAFWSLVTFRSVTGKEKLLVPPAGTEAAGAGVICSPPLLVSVGVTVTGDCAWLRTGTR